jgi:hypothetical protein
MDISDYRDQFASFNSALQLARYARHVGERAELERDEIYDRYSDLFSQSTIADLKSRFDETPAGYETERSGLLKLLEAAQIADIEWQASEVTGELASCESASRVEWNGEEIRVQEVPSRLARESNKRQRAEFAARWGGAISMCDDLRLMRLRSLAESRAGIVEPAKLDQGQLAAQALLEQTESAYTSGFSRLVSRAFPGELPGDLDFADLTYLEAMPWLGKSLSPRDPLRTYADTMEGLGIRVDQRPNIQIDLRSRANGNAAACFPVKPPDDVRIAASPQDGPAGLLGFMQQAGKAQHHAWCSKDLAKRHPEFIYSPDDATNEGYGYLFSYLALEPRWLLEFLPDIDAVQAARIANDVALCLAVRVRRLCADALYSVVLHEAGKSREQLQATYTELQERATRFRALPELFLVNHDLRVDPQSHLRALAFSFGLREYLRVRYGHRWWASRKAGDELIDLWNTASQYSVEELARLNGFGELNFDLLSESMITALKGAPG